MGRRFVPVALQRAAARRRRRAARLADRDAARHGLGGGARERGAAAVQRSARASARARARRAVHFAVHARAHALRLRSVARGWIARQWVRGVLAGRLEAAVCLPVELALPTLFGTQQFVGGVLDDVIAVCTALRVLSLRGCAGGVRRLPPRLRACR